MAAEVALALHGVLDAFVACKVSAPEEPELGIGAIAEGREDVVATAHPATLGVQRDEFWALARNGLEELYRRIDVYRAGQPLTPVSDRDVALIDDGLATGVTAEAALTSLREMEPRRLVLAAPVCARDARRRLVEIADDVVCLEAPAHLEAISTFYEDFEPVTDEDVVELLTTWHHHAA